MNNFKISTRLITLIGIMSALLIAIGSVGLSGIGQSNDALKSVYENRTVAAGQIADIQSDLLENRLAIAVSLVTPTPEFIAKQTAKIEANIAHIGKVWEAFMATTQTAEEVTLAKKFAEDRARFVQEGLLPTIAALRANDVNAAGRLVVEKIRPTYQPVGEGIDALMKLQLDEAKKEYEAAVARYATIRMVSIA
ncbi:Tar ligand binding domain-containing protein, partial [Herminiimonas sp. CN]|uniref:Tar ligand binding domain-containing protein n=1 Tax=Herminiimonas sp. CN TaxID=1349818 RepID=UPI000473674D